MAATWLKDLCEYLEDQSVGAVGTNIFHGRLPSSPDSAIAAYDAGGSYVPHGAEVPWNEHVAEFRVRAATHAAATTLAGSVITAVNGKAGITLNGSTVIHWMRADSTPALLEYDERRRAVLLVRVTLQVQRSMLY